MIATPQDSAWLASADAGRASLGLAAALRGGWLEGQRAVIFHDLGLLQGKTQELRAAFPDSTLHGLAIKANPLLEVLKVAVEGGFGLEAASLEEASLAEAAGCPPAAIVFDSPAKTESEIAWALERGVTLNADNDVEIARIHAQLVRTGAAPARIGLRINPQTGAGRIGATSVAGAYSKFGAPLLDRAEEIVELFVQYPFLNGLHVHTGSQGVGLTAMVEAVRRIFELRARIERARPGHPLAYIDIGGGLPWRYVDDDPIPPTPSEYWRALCEQIPAIAQGDLLLITEFGRAVQAGCGYAASRVEYVKTESGVTTAVIHLGADFLLRRVYNPDDWRHRFSVLAPDGSPKTGPLQPYHVAGPLCFGGDILARHLPLPEIAPGDWIVIHDVGAYTLSLWSRHCSRGIPRILGIDEGAGAGVRLLREAETPMDICHFWSATPGH